MKTMVFCALSISLSLICPAPLPAQKLDLPDTFLQKLETAGIELAIPLDSDYRDVSVRRDAHLRYDFAMRSHREDLEIRFLLIPYDERQPATAMPHIQATRAASTAATNDEEAIMTVLSVDDRLLAQCHADWGMIYLFTPKIGFSDKRLGKMLALYREGQGTALIFFLFDDPGNTAADEREVALRFR